MRKIIIFEKSNPEVFWRNVINKLEDVYRKYKVVSREDDFIPSKIIGTNPDGSARISDPEITIVLECKMSLERQKLKQHEVYCYGDGINAKPIEERLEEKLDDISKNETILLKHLNIIPPHDTGVNACGLKSHKGTEIFGYVLTTEKRD